ncbi:hypothetical protein AB6A40_009863 [Gnathostoma spinigerum]|uniref:Uncharacterized protein n=1 Tax=Gnathostoma spinigerum TaxID=75299 RepID=A0ABD6EYC7_9BILA
MKFSVLKRSQQSSASKFTTDRLHLSSNSLQRIHSVQLLGAQKAMSRLDRLPDYFRDTVEWITGGGREVSESNLVR